MRGHKTRNSKISNAITLSFLFIYNLLCNISVLCFNIIEKISDYYHNKTGTFFNFLKKMCQFCYGNNFEEKVPLT